MKAKARINVIVVGAGISGLSTAIALNNAGHRVTVLEQAPDFVEVGAGIQIPPNASRELIKWGLRDAMAAIASQPGRINYRNWQTGVPAGHTILSDVERRFGSPYWQVFRPDYHRVLLESAVKRGVIVHKGCEVKSYSPETASVCLQDGTVLSGDLVIAADGVKSIARKALNVDIEPHETGDTCFRIVIPAEKLLAEPDLAELVKTPGFEQWLGPDHHIIGYNVSKEKFFNLLMVIPDDNTMVGYKAPATAKEIRKAYSGWDPKVQKLLGFLPEDVERWRLIDLPPIDDWIHPSNKMIAIGDAVHATLPYLAQGAAMAVEDASALGCLFSHLNEPSEVGILLALFKKIRMERVHTIQRGSFTNRFFIHMQEGPQMDMRNQILAVGDNLGSPNLLGNTLFTNWLYGYDAEKETKALWNAAMGARL